ncbi:MAG: hypothetical protein L0214_10600 [candidate division NC10 bacterium]|nr:hypothetical protein [candidate division NC10 bacterium]
MLAAIGRAIWPLALALIVLVGCAGTVMTVETLRTEGYESLTFITPSGQRQEPDRYEVWVKESREAERTVRACLVPKIEGAGYHWRLIVLAGGKETWSYESGPLQREKGPTMMRRGIDCTASEPLPEGRLSFQIHYVSWE